MPLLQRRERRRHDDLVLLLNQLVVAAAFLDGFLARGPQAGRLRFLADFLALVEAVVRPDVLERVDLAELAVPHRGHRPELETHVDRGFPVLLDGRELAAGEVIGADLEERSLLADRDRLHEREGDHDLGLLRDDEFGDLRGPHLVLDGGFADLVALFHVLVAPDVDDLVERADLGVPESGELGVLLALFVLIAEALLDFGKRAWFDVVRPHFVDHGGPFSVVFRWEGR